MARLSKRNLRPCTTDYAGHRPNCKTIFGQFRLFDRSFSNKVRSDRLCQLVWLRHDRHMQKTRKRHHIFQNSRTDCHFQQGCSFPTIPRYIVCTDTDNNPMSDRISTRVLSQLNESSPTRYRAETWIFMFAYGHASES